MEIFPLEKSLCLSYVLFLSSSSFSLLPQATTCFTMPHSEGMPPSPTTTMGELLMLTTRPRMKLHERCPPHATGFLNRESPRGSLRAFHLQRNISCIENENKPQMGVYNYVFFFTFYFLFLVFLSL